MARTVDRLRAKMRTVRSRSALLAAVTVAVGLALAFLVVLLLYRNQLQSNLDQTLSQQAEDRARLLDAGSAPGALTTVLQDEAFVWIAAVDGEVIAQGGSLLPLEDPLPDRLGVVGDKEILVLEQSPDEVEKERKTLRIATAVTSEGDRVVLVGAETEGINNSVVQLLWLFIAALPVLVVFVAAVTWRLVGRALRPVEAMRHQAQSITGTTLDERIPEPTSGDEIQRLAETMNAMLGRVESHDKALRSFTADASHELKSPVANVRALTESASIEDPAWPELRSRIAGETERLRDLVENLLYLASSEGGRTAIDPVPVGLDDLLFDEAQVVAATGRVDVDLSGVEPVVTLGTRGALAQLVRNLVDNAARHASSRVWLACGETDGVAFLEVSDDGPGVPEHDRERIFERFTRLDEARSRDAGGSGLGLAIVARIADDHDGSVAVGQSAAGGASFVVRFPAARV